MEKGTTCTFTGHREAKLPWGGNEDDPRCVKLKRAIFDAVEAVYQSGIRHFICGMATGCDMYFGEAVLELQRSHGEISLEAAIPFEGQSRGWDEKNRKRYERLAAECDYQTVIHRDYTPSCMMDRNR